MKKLKKLYPIIFLLTTFNILSGQTIKIDVVQISYPLKDKLPITVYLPINTFSIDGQDIVEQTNFKLDYFDILHYQMKVISKSLFSDIRYISFEEDTAKTTSYTLIATVEGVTKGKVVTAFSDMTTKIDIVWKFVSNADSTILFREEISGEFTNNIGNAFSGKANAKKRVEQAIIAAYLNSYDLLYSKISEHIEN